MSHVHLNTCMLLITMCVLCMYMCVLLLISETGSICCSDKLSIDKMNIKLTELQTDHS